MIWKNTLKLFGLSAILMTSCPLSAAPVPPAGFSARGCFGDDNHQFGFSVSCDFENGFVSEQMTALLTGGASPMVDLQMHLSGVPTSDGAFADAAYYWRFEGPAGSFIPISITTRGDLSGSGNWTGFAYVVVLDNVFGRACHPANTSLNCSDHWGNTINTFVVPNTLYSVVLHANVAIAGSGTAQAVADPLITIDPTFEGRDLYTFAISPGLEATVPEPDTLALFGTALAAMGLLRRGRGADGWW